jgi:hypothetical protein
MMGGGYVPSYHTHTIIVTPSIVATPMIFVIEGIVVCDPTKRVSILILVMPWRTNSTKDRRLSTFVPSKPNLESILDCIKPST